MRDLRRAGRWRSARCSSSRSGRSRGGGFWFLSSNLGRAVAQWRDHVRVIVLPQGARPRADALVARVRAVPGVAAVRYVSKADALAVAAAARSDRTPRWPTSSQRTRCPRRWRSPRRRRRDARGGPRAHGAASPGFRRRMKWPEALDWVDRLSHWRRLLQGQSARDQRGPGGGGRAHGHDGDHARAARATRRDGDHAAGGRAGIR